MSPGLAERHAILDTLARYCRGIDRMDWPLVRDCYTRDGVDHHTGFDGDADAYVEWLRTKLPSFDGTMHILGTHLAEIADGEAVVETSATAVHWGTPSDDPRLNFTSGVRYVDHMRGERDGRWRIVERFAVREWTRDDTGRDLTPEAAGPRARRGGGDPIDVLRERILGR